MRQLRGVIQPIRDAMSKQENKFEGEFTTESQISSVPIQLLSEHAGRRAKH